MYLHCSKAHGNEVNCLNVHLKQKYFSQYRSILKKNYERKNVIIFLTNRLNMYFGTFLLNTHNICFG